VSFSRTHVVKQWYLLRRRRKKFDTDWWQIGPAILRFFPPNFSFKKKSLIKRNTKENLLFPSSGQLQDGGDWAPLLEAA
jgi:hypothetical protein